MLSLDKDGSIYYIDSDNKNILMDNVDIKNMLFSGLVLDESFSYRSFFLLLEKYDFFTTIFEYANSYIEEFESLETPKQKEEGDLQKLSVLTPCVNLINEEMVISYKMEIYYKDDPDTDVNEDLSIMKMEEYIDYVILLNSIGHIISGQTDSDEIDYTFINFNPSMHIPLIEFINLVLNNLSVHGYPFERNNVITSLNESLEEDNDYLEEQAKDITEGILKAMQKGDK